MIEFINEYLPSIVAGLVPSVLNFALTFMVVLKNLKVNKYVDSLDLSVMKLLKREGDLDTTINEATKAITNLTNDFKAEIEGLVKEFKKEFKSDIYNINEKIEEKFEESKKIADAKLNEVKRKIDNV